MTMTAKDFADGLRQLANWYEANPEAILPYDPVIRVSADDTKEEVLRLTRLLGTCKKEYRGTIFALVKTFGPVGLEFLFYRDTVCERRVVGQRKVPARPAEPERLEDVIEWDCKSILGEDEHGGEA